MCIVVVDVVVVVEVVEVVDEVVVVVDEVVVAVVDVVDVDTGRFIHVFPVPAFRVSI